MIEKVMLALGILSLGYFLGIVVYTGFSSKFPVIWAIAGICFWAVAWIWHQKISIPAGVKIIMGAGIAGVIVLFIIVEGFIINGMLSKAENDMEYIIVLGAQVNGRQPSLSLKYRIDEAAEYLEKHPKTVAILSGGKGTGEEISEAECMKQELINLGIAAERLLEEKQSTNTKENVEYSYEIIQKHVDKQKEKLKIGIVTNGFHICRSTAIARKTMEAKIYGIPAKSNGFLQLNYMVREFFGIIKDKLKGNL